MALADTPHWSDSSDLHLISTRANPLDQKLAGGQRKQS
jgi:hypothetical protein